MQAQRGMRGKLEQYVNVQQEFTVTMQVQGRATYDFSCFGVDADGKLSDERYMVFYNQPRAPGGEIVFTSQGAQAQFACQLAKLPSNIQKLVFTASIDGSGTMRDIASHALAMRQGGQDVLTFALSGTDFQQERAIISMEVYKKDGVWRFAMLGAGFNGGLGDLLRSYGGEELEAPSSTPAAAPAAATPSAAAPAPAPKLSLEKKLEKSAPKLVSLAKPITIELQKRGLLDCVARVALVLDISGSMRGRFANGTVQEIVNKILPLAVQFDDDGELDFWYYGTRAKRMPSVNMGNYQRAVPADWEQLMRELGYGNNEPAVMREVVDEYRTSSLPAYVVFVTDGGVSSERGIQKILIEASRMPIFWQFVGVGGSGYGVLERLDCMSGRYVDNANFFALDDFRSVSNSKLYGRLLNEFPQWLREIGQKGILSGISVPAAPQPTSSGISRWLGGLRRGR